MPKNKKSPVEKAAIKHAEKLFDSNLDNITRKEARLDFQNCVWDFIAGHKKGYKLGLKEGVKIGRAERLVCTLISK